MTSRATPLESVLCLIVIYIQKSIKITYKKSAIYINQNIHNMELFTPVSFINNFKSKTIISLITLFSVISTSYAHKQLQINSTLLTNTQEINSNIATDWANMTLYILKNTPKGTPTYYSRALGYLGLSMYESTVQGNVAKVSIAPKLGLSLIKAQPKQKYNWAIALNAAQSTMLKSLFPYTDAKNIQKIDSLENYNFTILSARNLNAASVSQLYGKTIANQIFEWSKTDGGHEGFKRNFDTTYILPSGKGYWSIPMKGQIITSFPLHPTWGRNRTFASANFTLPIPAMLPFGFEENSPYYQNMKAVFDKGKTLTQEEKEIANWWGDDPGHSYSPPGHSYNLATLVIQKKKVDLFTAAEIYARVGMGVSDAFVNCWKCKYYYHVERPANYIFYNLSTLWELYWPEPPFPAFYSGHATQAASTAAVLTAIFGENFEFDDDTNVFIPRDEQHGVDYKKRHFTSFRQVAEETAKSRFYGGIHTAYDNKIGLEEGAKIGKNINELFNSK
jgi:hypothetical protein